MKDIQSNIMKRVKRVHFVKYVFLPHAFFVFLAGISLYVVSTFVSVGSVVSNTISQSGVLTGFVYIARSFAHTDGLTQLSLSMVLLSVAIYGLYIYSHLKYQKQVFAI